MKNVPLLLFMLIIFIHCNNNNSNLGPETLGLKLGRVTSYNAVVYFESTSNLDITEPLMITLNDSLIEDTFYPQMITIEDLKSDTDYRLTIYNSNYKESVDFKTLRNQPPAGNFNIVFDSITNTTAKFHFNLPNDPEKDSLNTTYIVNNKIVDSERIITKRGLGDLVFSKITGLEKGQELSLKIIVTDSKTEPLYSDPMTFITPGPDGFLVHRMLFNNREAIIYEPNGVKSKPGFSMTIFFPGWGHDVKEMMAWPHSKKRIEIMDKHNTVFMMPQGVRGGEGEYHWTTISENPDSNQDILFTKNMIEYAQSTFNIPDGKIHFFGYSAGGAMSCYAGLYFQDKVASVATILSYYSSNLSYKLKTPERAIPHLNVMATGDDIIPYDEYESARINWLELYSEDVYMKSETFKNNLQKPHTTVEKYKYYSSLSNKLLYQHDKIIGGYHGSPGSPWGPTNPSYFMEEVCEVFFDKTR